MANYARANRRDEKISWGEAVRRYIKGSDGERATFHKIVLMVMVGLRRFGMAAPLVAVLDDALVAVPIAGQIAAPVILMDFLVLVPWGIYSFIRIIHIRKTTAVRPRNTMRPQANYGPRASSGQQQSAGARMNSGQRPTAARPRTAPSR